VESERADAAVAQGREKPAFSAMEINTISTFSAPQSRSCRYFPNNLATNDNII
jgi:hypothetical protein